MVARRRRVVIAAGRWLTWTAGRLDRLHLRCEGAAAALDAALAERRALAVEVAAHPSTDAASAVLLLDAATAGRSFQHESDLSAVFRAVRPDAPADAPVGRDRRGRPTRPAGPPDPQRPGRDQLLLRSRRRVRWFRLAGHAAPPPMVAFDDRVPSADPGPHARPDVTWDRPTGSTGFAAPSMQPLVSTVTADHVDEGTS